MSDKEGTVLLIKTLDSQLRQLRQTYSRYRTFEVLHSLFGESSAYILKERESAQINYKKELEACSSKLGELNSMRIFEGNSSVSSAVEQQIIQLGSTLRDHRRLTRADAVYNVLNRLATAIGAVFTRTTPTKKDSVQPEKPQKTSISPRESTLNKAGIELGSLSQKKVRFDMSKNTTEIIARQEPESNLKSEPKPKSAPKKQRRENPEALYLSDPMTRENDLERYFMGIIAQRGHKFTSTMEISLESFKNIIQKDLQESIHSYEDEAHKNPILSNSYGMEETRKNLNSVKKELADEDKITQLYNNRVSLAKKARQGSGLDDTPYESAKNRPEVDATSTAKSEQTTLNYRTTASSTNKTDCVNFNSTKSGYTPLSQNVDSLMEKRKTDRNRLGPRKESIAQKNSKKTVQTPSPITSDDPRYKAVQAAKEQMRRCTGPNKNKKIEEITNSFTKPEIGGGRH